MSPLFHWSVNTGQVCAPSIRVASALASISRCPSGDATGAISSQAAGDRPSRITGESIGDPPFVSLRLAEIAADRARESDRTWSRNG